MAVLQKVCNRILWLLSFSKIGRKSIASFAFDQLAETTYDRLRKRGFSPNGIIDIGAYKGDWTRLIRTIYSDAPILMIDALADAPTKLEIVCAEVPRTQFEVALLSSEADQAVTFNVQETGSSMFAERSDAPRTTVTMQTSTLDDILLKHPNLAAPLFVKIDVQGAELKVLQGGAAALRQSEVVQLEIALAQYNEGAPGCVEVISFMEQNGFAIAEFAGFVRPFDQDLVQVDVVFVRKDSTLRKDFFRFSSLPAA